MQRENRFSYCRSVLALLIVSLMCLAPWAVADELSPAPEGSFSIVVLPDTQQYKASSEQPSAEDGAEVTNPVFAAHVRWIGENLEAQRIVFVSHVGDIVDKNRHDQWRVARHCMDQLHGRVPYGISVGNHDMTSGGDSSLFQEYFPAGRFEDFPWYGGHYAGNDGEPRVSGNNANSYALFTVGEQEFVFLHLECNAPDDVLAWADDVLSEHADRHALITTHMALGPLQKPDSHEGFIHDPKGRMQWSKIHGPRGNTPQQMWDKCFRKHPNLMLIFCGDQSRTSAMHVASLGDHSNMVHSLLSDYTSSGPLRVYRFLPSENVVQVITYDTTLGELVTESRYVPGRENHQFTIPVKLVKAAHSAQ